MESRYCIYKISMEHQIRNKDGSKENMRGSFGSLKVEEIYGFLEEVLTYYEIDDASKAEIKSDMNSFFEHTPWACVDDISYVMDQTDSLVIHAEKVWKEY